MNDIKQSLFGFLTIVVLLTLLSCSGSALQSVTLEIDPTLKQAVFETAEDAANTFVFAIENSDATLLNEILGSNYRQVLPLDQVTAEDQDNFINAWNKKHILLAQGNKKMLLAVGTAQWTLPIPIAEAASGWYFDIEEGLERMRIRRIGRNELATMQAVLAYYDAQMEYAEQDRNNDGILEYAQKFISTAETHDGLYWEAQPNEPLSPLGSLLADRSPGGGYHGYYYRILKVQGENARGGAYSYLMAKQMRAGFALIAWPEEYGESGIMSFMISHVGIVYEQDLGPGGADMAKHMTVYDPGTGWIPAEEVNAVQALSVR